MDTKAPYDLSGSETEYSESDSEWLVDDEELHCLEDDGQQEDFDPLITHRGLLRHVTVTGRPSHRYPPGSLVRLVDGDYVVIHCSVAPRSLGTSSGEALFFGLYFEFFADAASSQAMEPPLTGPWVCYALDPWVHVAFITESEIECVVLPEVEPSRYGGHFCAITTELPKPRNPGEVLQFLFENTRLGNVHEPANQLAFACAFAEIDSIYSSVITPLLNFGRGGHLQWPRWLPSFLLDREAQIISKPGALEVKERCVLCASSKPIAFGLQICPGGPDHPVGRHCGVRVSLARDIIQYLLGALRFRRLRPGILESYRLQASAVLTGGEHYYDSGRDWTNSS